jgi:hypothetical protein
MSTINYTYNVIVDRFRQFAAGHFQLRRFTHGEISQADLEKEAEWPWLHVKPRAINYAPGTRAFSFEIFISDLPRDKEDKTGYQAESITDCSLIFQDLINEIYLGNMFGSDVLLTRPVNSEPFVEQYTHTLTGVTGTIELNLDYDWSACSIPASWNYNTPTDSQSDGWGALQFIESLDQNGVYVSLLNDEETPGNSYYYGTNASGVKGWYATEAGGLTCEDLPDCATIISILEDIEALQTDVALKANSADLGATAFSNDYNDLDNLPTIPTATSDLTNDGADGVNPFITAQDLPDTSGFVPYTGATQNVDLGTHTLSAKDLVINHSSGSGVAASITKGGAGEALTVNKTSGSGNAMSVTGGVTQLSELHLTTDLADAYIASAATWNAKVPQTRTLTINGTTQDLSANRTFTIATGLTVGTTPITSGTVGRVLFEGTGNVLQESANLFWDNTNNKLGIGTSNFVGSIRLAVNGQIGGATFSSTYLDLTGGTPELRGNSGIGFYGAGGNHIWYGTSSAERMRLFANGNFAINTTTDAGFKLDVNGTARVQGNAQFGTGFYWDNTNSRLGIGTATPENQFQVRGGTVTSYAQVTSGVGIQTNSSGSGLITALNLTPAAPTAGISNGANFGFNGSANNFFGIGLGDVRTSKYDIWFQTGSQNGGGYRWYIGTTERMTLFQNGNFGIGTTTDAGFKLDVNGDSRIKGAGSTNATFALRVQNSAGTDLLTIKNANTAGAFNLNAPGGGKFGSIEIVGLQIGAGGGNTVSFPYNPIAIGGTLAVASAQLQMDSTTRGFLPPRMTNAQRLAIASPAVGLIVYCTDLVEGLYVNKSTGWTFVI